MKGTLDVGLTYGNASPCMENTFLGFVEADHAALVLNSVAVCWASRKIKESGGPRSRRLSL